MAPLQKSTIITQQSSIHGSKKSGTVPGYSSQWLEKLGDCPRVFQAPMAALLALSAAETVQSGARHPVNRVMFASVQ